MLNKTFCSIVLFLFVLRVGARADNGVLAQQADNRPQQITLGGKTYKAHWIAGAFGESGNYVSVRRDLAYIFDGEKTYVVDPLHAQLVSTLPSKYPVLGLLPPKALALINEDPPNPFAEPAGRTVIDIKTQEVIARFVKFNPWGGWIFSPNGKFVFPLSQVGKEYEYIDVTKKSIVQIPVWNEDEGLSSVSCASVSDGQTLLIFACATRKVESANERPQQGAVYLYKIMRIETADPARVTMTLSTPDVEQPFAVRDETILCGLRKFEINGNDIINEYRLGFLNSQTLKVEKTTSILKNDAIGWAGWTPDGKEIYALGEDKGLSIYDANTLKPLADLGVGQTVISYSIGATFSADGKFAYIAEPYSGKIFGIDVASRKVIETNSQLGQGIAGVLPIGDECFVITTLLP